MNEYLMTLDAIRRRPTIDLCYLAIAQYDIYGGPTPPYRVLSLLYEMQGRYDMAMRITQEMIDRGIGDAEAPRRLERQKRRAYGY